MNKQINYDARIKELIELFKCGCISKKDMLNQANEYYIQLCNK